MDNPLIFLKLGGSLLTDKAEVEALRSDVLARLALEIAAAYALRPELRLVLGHGSGSFGHYAAARYGTRHGVSGRDAWHGFTVVSDAAARLNRHVVAALLNAGVPAVSLSPLASAVVRDGRIDQLALGPVASALDAGLLPVVYGDVAFDAVRGGTIISTEEVLEFLARALGPAWLLLAGETAGVLDLDGRVVPLITRASLPEVAPALGGSRGVDVTGGMVGKVAAVLDLLDARPGLAARIFSGLESGLLTSLLLDPAATAGTRLA